MLRRSANVHHPIMAGVYLGGARRCRVALSFVLAIFCLLRCHHVEAASHYVTNTAQFGLLTGADYLEGCDFVLSGFVTLVDPGRDLMVLQDDTGSVALNFPLRDTGLQSGQRVSLEGSNCCPYLARFPDFPLRPSGRELKDTFEVPTGGGEYFLERLRGYLRPATSGEYSFWIASDNSSELWLSSDSNPAKARKIASIPRFGWVPPREWSRYPSQHSELISLQAGRTYYIEALREQTTLADDLAVAWEGPGLEQSVIDGRFLVPCGNGLTGAETNGVLREYWTNYSAGSLSEISGARPFQSALSVERVRVCPVGPAPWPNPEPVVIGQPWRDEMNYRWVSTEGTVKFVGAEEDAVLFELAGETARILVRAPRLGSSLLQQMRNARVRFEGVCEGVYGNNDMLELGIIWVPGENHIHLLKDNNANLQVTEVEHTNTTVAADANPRQGFYTTRGVVTFHDRVLDQEYLVVQENESAVLVSGGETFFLQGRLKVGECVELGGALQPGKVLPVLAPLVITELGWHCLPAPNVEPMSVPVPASRAGKWSELAGMVHSVNSNGLLSVVTKDGPVLVWVGDADADELAGCVDSRLSLHGVFWPNARDIPYMLVPSRNYVDVEKSGPDEPFEIRASSISELMREVKEPSRAHRVKVTGEITHRDAFSFFVQDGTGGIRVAAPSRLDATIGDSVEVLGFPTVNGSARVLTEVSVRPAKVVRRVIPKRLDLSEALSARQSGTLVVANATLLAWKTNDDSQVLELQEQQRVFTATLATNEGHFADLLPGTRLQVTGVCDHETAPTRDGEESAQKNYFVALNVLLRSPADVKVLSGPPWWTWQRMMTLVGALATVLAITLLWIHLLRRRLERQQAARLAFSQQVLGKLEEERRRIAANLHDSLGHTLLVIKNHALVASQSRSNRDEAAGHMSEISVATSQAIEEVRRIAQGLRPSQLDRLGLSEAIRACINQASENGSILFANRVDDIDGLFDDDGEIHVFRIVQEAITNVVKHSGATEATVVMKKRETSLSLSVRDNGCGFDPAKLSSPMPDLGYGLTGIRERARILGGSLTLDARLGSGTRLTVEVPFKLDKLL